MALKLRRRAGMFTNESLAHRISMCPLEALGTGADSFKRVLGCSGYVADTYPIYVAASEKE